MPADASERLAPAARQRHVQTLARARTALRPFEASIEFVTCTGVAATAKVSRAWLYRQPEIKAAVERLREMNGRSTATAPVPARQHEASLVRRLEAAPRRNQELTHLVTDLRIQLGAAHGAMRDSKTGR